MVFAVLAIPPLFAGDTALAPSPIPTETVTPVATPPPIPIECQCVAYVKKVTGLPFMGDAIEWKKHINQTTPSRGAVVVLNASVGGHLGRVIDYTTTTMTFRSQNWSGPCIVENTTIPLDDSRIIGYIIY